LFSRSHLPKLTQSFLNLINYLNSKISTAKSGYRAAHKAFCDLLTSLDAKAQNQ
jgi:hypothetical protein